MQYQILILAAKEKLSAIDVAEDGAIETISIEGNEIMSYKSAEDIRDFVGCIKEYYNMEDFSDIDSVFIVKFDALSGDAVCIFEEMKSAKECNLVSIEKLLPMLVLKEGLAKPDIELQVEMFGCAYSVKIDSDLKFECGKGENGEQKVKLPIERLSQIFCFDGDNLIDNKQELKNCQEKFQDELNCKKDEIDKLEKNLKKLQKERDKIAADLSNLYKEREEKNKNAKRYICRIRLEFSDRWEFKIKYVATDCDVVRKKQTIAVLQTEQTLVCAIRMNDIEIKATGDGRLFFLMTSGKTVKDGDAVALIGDLSDTRADIMQWYEKNK